MKPKPRHIRGLTPPPLIPAPMVVIQSRTFVDQFGDPLLHGVIGMDVGRNTSGYAVLSQVERHVATRSPLRDPEVTPSQRHIAYDRELIALGCDPRRTCYNCRHRLRFEINAEPPLNERTVWVTCDLHHETRLYDERCEDFQI